MGPAPPTLTMVPFESQVPPAQKELVTMLSGVALLVRRLYNDPQAGCLLIVTALCSALSITIAREGETMESCIAETPVVPFWTSVHCAWTALVRMENRIER